MSDQSAQFIGSIPENYDKGLCPRLFDYYAEDLTARAARLGPKSVLELAAGTGIVSRKLRDALPDDCSIVASDLNAPMLEVARTKFDADENIRFEEVDATNIGFSDEQFDLVVCQFGIMFFPDKVRSFKEVRGILKPDGNYLFSVWDTWKENEFAKVAHNAVEGFYPDNPPGFYKVPFSYNDEDEIRSALIRGGFSGVDIEYLRHRSVIPSIDAFAKGLVFGNPLYDEIVIRGGDPNTICGAVADAIKRELGGELSIQAIVVEAKAN